MRSQLDDSISIVKGRSARVAFSRHHVYRPRAVHRYSRRCPDITSSCRGNLIIILRSITIKRIGADPAAWSSTVPGEPAKWHVDQSVCHRKSTALFFGGVIEPSRGDRERPSQLSVIHVQSEQTITTAVY